MISRVFAFLLMVGAFDSGVRRSSAQDTDQPLPPNEAARTMIVPEGFNVTLFAGEPDVKQPISFCIDDRGRLWVAEAYNYPHHGTTPGDRIVIFEDADQDGRFDKRTIFYDKLNYVTGIEVGFGGAWVMSPPYFYFIADGNGDDVPDSEPDVLLDGFGNHANAHNVANGFAWGPDGWLYGTHGRTNWSMLGKPGTPESERVHYDGGVYRYHPVRHVWEPFADGTTNPWGIDWDDYGEGFVCNCVDPHLFHVIQGAHYQPWRNRESSQFAYQRIPSIADHLHFIGGGNIRDGIGTAAEDEAGGGHAHCGTMVYLGDNWPERYRNTVFMNNIHGRRINNDLLRRAGSGYTAPHGSDLMRSRDTWFMGVTLLYGPDGAVFVSDWSDTGECHSVKNTRRHTGRIYKIAYEGERGQGPEFAGQGQDSAAAQSVDLKRLSDSELVALQLHRNDWHVRHARRLLQERAAAGHDMSSAHQELHAMFASQIDVTRQLRALWALHVTGGLNDEFLVGQLDHSSEYVRSWAIRLLCEDREPPQQALERFRELAATGDSPFDRLHLASALQQLAPEQRWPIASALLSRAEDAHDANLPLMVWYGIEPLVHDDVKQFVSLAASAKPPLVCRHIARRVASGGGFDEGLDALVELLSAAGADDARLDVLTGMLEGLEGKRSAAMPRLWPDTYSKINGSGSQAAREQALQLALIFDDPIAHRLLLLQAADANAAAAARTRAIQSLVSKKANDIGPLLLQLITDAAVRNAAIRGLAEYDQPETVPVLLDYYGSLDAAARQDALQTLASRPAWALALLDAVEANRIPRSDLTAYTARQLRNLGDDNVTARVTALWGELRTTPEDKARLIERYKRRMTPESLARADRTAGRAIFQKVCANCHRLFDTGATIGPDITGSQRKNIDYMLENLIDPSAAVSRDFQMQVMETSSGRIVTGLVVAETENAVTVQTVNERLVIPVAEIESRATSPVSMMPDGMLNELSTEQVRDLIAYLASPTQVSLGDSGPEAR